MTQIQPSRGDSSEHRQGRVLGRAASRRKLRMIAAGVALLVIAGVVLIENAGSPRNETPIPFGSPKTKPISNGTVPLHRYFCGTGAGYPGIHFYQTAPSSPDAGPALPHAPASPTAMSDCKLEQTIGYVLPPNNPGVGTTGFYFFPNRRGDNYYATAATPARADAMASLLGNTATLIGYVRPPSGNTCPVSDSAPLWKFYNGHYDLYINDPAEASGHPVINGGVTACLFTSPVFERLQKNF